MKLIFKDLETLRKVVAVNADLSFENLAPYLHSAQLFVARFVGEALVDGLATAVFSNANLNQVQQALWDRIRVPVANLATAKYARFKNVMITDAGVLRTSSEQQKDAFEWQLSQALAQLQEEAWQGLEYLLRFLEEKKADYPAYTDSAEYATHQASLIRSAQVFSRYYFIADSRLTFWSLQSCLRAAEARVIRPLLGSVYATLLAEANLSDEQTLQLDGARRALAYETISRALRERIVEVTDAGVQVNAISQYTLSRHQTPASDIRLQQTLAYIDQQAAAALADLAGTLTDPTTPGSGLGVQGDKIIAF
ncbi:DUF6712 family protein [Larkinella soli]|uniref:DUF6712 family protein n=1 Tax=Larkinella soli TaxID=1770527 RepID=UPI000FFC2894|nr:DUF6712 family protein [Larkinella soli]